MVVIVTILLLWGFLGHTNSEGDVPDTNKNVHDILNVFKIHEPKITDAGNSDVTAKPGFKKRYKVFKQMCDKNGGAGTFENLERDMYEGTECIDKFFLMGQKSEEMERYALTKDLHYMFKNYCPNAPVLKECAINYIAPLQACQGPGEKMDMKLIENVIDALLSFACYEDGDHIIQFISAHGAECLESKEQEIKQCIIATLPHHSNANNGSSAGSHRPPFLVFRAEECTIATAIRNCVVKKLEECSDPTPAKIVDFMLDVSFLATPCKEFLTDPSAASTSTINLLATSIVFLVLRLIFSTVVRTNVIC